MKPISETPFERHPLATGIILEALTLGGALAGQLLLASSVAAAPAGADIVAGNGSVSKFGSTTKVTQTSSHLAINWDSFNVGENERVQFVQPSSSALVLNRILDQKPSKIRGSIDANGNVLLVNPRGIMFTETATVNVGGLVASGLDVSITDFMNGNILFKGLEGDGGAVINRGVINASSAALIGKSVSNAQHALISAEVVFLAAGDEALLTFDADGLMGVRVTKEVLEKDLGLDAAILNEGSISGQKVLLEASISKDLFSNAVNNQGVITAKGIDVSGGSIRLFGSGGQVTNTGDLLASGASGGSVSVTGDKVVNTGRIKAEGISGSGGAIQIDATELHNAGSIDSGSGGMTIDLGRDGKDSNNTLGILNSADNIVVNARGGTDGTDSFTFSAGKNYALQDSGVVSTQGMTISGADIIDAGDDGMLQGRHGVAESFVITGNQELRVDGMTFSNIATVNAGTGDEIDSVTGAANWELQGTKRVSARGVLFTEVEQVNGRGAELSIAGRDHVAESFVITGSKKLTVDEMMFSNVMAVNAGSGSAADQVSGAVYWALNGDNSVIAGGMTFHDVEQVSGSGTGSTLTGRNDVAEAFVITGSKALTANNITFDNISVVNAGSGADPDKVTGSAQWLLNGNQSLKAEDMTFSGVEEVGTLGDNSQLTGSVNSTETFTLTGNNRLTVSGMNVAGVGSVIGQSTDQVQDGGDLHYELHSQTEARVANLHLQGLALANIQWDAGDSIAVAAGHALGGKTINSKGAHIMGSQEADAFTITGANTVDYSEIKFTNVIRVDALGGQDSVVGATEWALQGNKSVHAQGITFNSIEQAGSAVAESRVTGRDDVAEAFAITGRKALSVEGIAFTNVTAVDGGSGAVADRVTGAAEWQLNGSRSVIAGGMTFADIEQAGTAGRAGVLIGRNEVGEAFAITADRALTADDIAFTHITTVDAGSGIASDQVTGATDWALQGHQRVSAQGITFSGVEQAGSTGLANRISGQNDVGESFVITGHQALSADGISFHSVVSVNAGSGAAADRVTGADEWQLGGQQSVNAAGIAFAGVEQAGSDAVESRIAGRDHVAESFAITGNKALNAEGIAFTNVTAVDAGAGHASDRVSGAEHWQLNDNQSVTAGGIVFSGVEQASGVATGSRITGRDHVADSFFITGNRALTAEGIVFTNVTAVDAGAGTTPDRVSGADHWQLNGHQSVKAEGITFSGVERAGSSDLSGRITGQDGVPESFLITGRKAVTVDSVQFDNITEVTAGAGGDNRVESAAALEWQLTGGQQELIAQEMTFRGIETAQHTGGVRGYSRVRGSDQADSFHVSGAQEIIANGVRITGIDSVDGRGNAGGSDVLASSQVERWQLSTDASVQVEHSGIRFTGLEEIQGAMGSSLTGTSGNDDFVVGAMANRVSRDNLTYSNITHLDAGAGDDTLHAGPGYTWQLTDTARQLTSNGITYQNIDIATAVNATVKGRDGVSDIFEIGATHQQVKTQGLTFNSVARVEGGTGAGDAVISHTVRDWQLTPEHNTLQAAGIDFSAIETAGFSSAVNALGALNGSSADEIFDISGGQRNAVLANGIAFTQIGSVNAGGGRDRVVSADTERWSLTGVNAQVSSEDIHFSGVESVGAKTGTSPSSALRGSDSDETYVIDAAKNTVAVAGISFDHVHAIDAGGGQDAVHNTRETQWRAVEQGGSVVERSAEAQINSIWVLFANIEQVLNTGAFSGPSVGADYTLTDTHAVQVSGIGFEGVSAIHAGSGVDTLYGLNLDTEWTLNGQSGSTQYLHFTGMDTIRAGSARDVFSFNSGLSGNVFTGDGDDTVYLNGGSVADLYLQGGADRVFINSAGSSARMLDGGAGADSLMSNLADLTWQITGDVNQVNHVGDYAFTGFETLMNGSDRLTVKTAVAALFDVDNVVFQGTGINLGYRATGDIQFTSHYQGRTALSGTITGGALDVMTSGGVDLHTKVEKLNIRSNDNRSINIAVQESDHLVVGQIHAGAGGTISLTSMGLGALTAETRGVTHLKADTVNLGSEWQRWSAIGEQLNPLRMDVGRAVNIVSLSYVEPEFVNGIPSLTAAGSRLQSVTGAVASQGMKSAVQSNVEEFTQVDPAIFTAVSSYSVNADAVNAPEFALIAGELLPAHSTAEASGEVDGERAALTDEEG